MTKLLGEDRGYVPQPAAYEYKPPSVFARHKALTALFAALLLALAAYVWISLHSPPKDPPLPVPPVYIEPIEPYPPSRPGTPQAH